MSTGQTQDFTVLIAHRRSFHADTTTRSVLTCMNMDIGVAAPMEVQHREGARKRLDKWMEKGFDMLEIDTALVLALAIDPERREQIVAAEATYPDNFTRNMVEINLRNYEDTKLEFAAAGLELTEEALDASIAAIRATTQRIKCICHLSWNETSRETDAMAMQILGPCRDIHFLTFTEIPAIPDPQDENEASLDC
jgi:hypothetical protein